MTEHNLPWSYRPRESDDWGFIRDAAGDLAACARGEKGGKTHDEHRTDGTDPYGANAVFIVKAVNNHDALVKALQQIVAGSKNADIGNSEFRLKALQTAQGVLGHVEGSGK